MRRKLLAVAQRLGITSNKATRLAAAASDHAKDVTRKAVLEVRVDLHGSNQANELCIDFLSSHPGVANSLRLAFDRIESLDRRRATRLASLL